MGELTSNGKRFVALIQNMGFAVVLPTIIILPLVICYNFDFSNWHSFWIGLLGGTMWLFLTVIACGVYYLIFPNIGMIAHDSGYITDEELQVVVNRRIPKSIYVGQKRNDEVDVDVLVDEYLQR